MARYAFELMAAHSISEKVRRLCAKFSNVESKGQVYNEHIQAKATIHPQIAQMIYIYST